MSIINKPDYKIFANDAKTGEIETFPDLLRGWGVTIDRTAGKPPMEWFNAIGKRADEWMMYLSQRGLPEWDTVVDYPQHAVVQHAGKFYSAKKQTRGQRPDQSQNEWILFSDAIGIRNASPTQPGIVQLNNAVDSNNETQAATPKAVKAAHDLANTANQNATTANNNANTRLEKAKNGADIPDPKRFVENLGLADTVKRANNAYSAVNKPSPGEI
ncbi:tail fiber protein, partial [Xenorhabdus bovienii]